MVRPGRPSHLTPLPDLPPSGPGPRSGGVGCWRVRRDGKLHDGLPAAISAVRRGRPDRLDLQALAWQLMPRLPGLPLASDTLKTDAPTSSRLPLEQVAVTHPWAGFNTVDATNLVWVDCDHQRWPALLARARAIGLPEPAWIARSRRGAHIVWILRTPVVIRLEDLAADGRRARLLSVTHSLLRRALEGDDAASLSGLMKNPWSPRWEVTVADRVQAVDLTDLLRPLEALAAAEGWEAPKRRRRSSREPSAEGRNCGLFDMVRFRAYETGETGAAVLLGHAEELNGTFPVPLPAVELRAIARSISRWMVRRYTGRTRAAPLTPEEIRVRRVQAGKTTAAARAADRDQRLWAVMEDLRASGLPVTQAAVAEAARVSERTVRRAWPSIADRTLAPPPSGSSSGSSTSLPLSQTSAPIGEDPEEDIDGPILAPLFADLMADEESDSPSRSGLPVHSPCHLLRHGALCSARPPRNVHGDAVHGVVHGRAAATGRRSASTGTRRLPGWAWTPTGSRSAVAWRPSTASARRPWRPCPSLTMASGLPV